MSKKYIFNYIVTNKVNGKQYVGMHSTNNLNDGYLGGGILLTKAVNKYGKCNFSKKILNFHLNNESAFKKEEYYIDKYNTIIPHGYNISPKGGVQMPGGISEEGKKKIGERSKGNKYSLGHKHSDESKAKMSMAKKGKPSNTLGKKMSDETKRKLSESKIGNIPWNKDKKGCFSEDVLKRMSEKRKGVDPWNKDLKNCHSEETIQKIIEKNKLHRETYGTRKHSEESKNKMRNSYQERILEQP